MTKNNERALTALLNYQTRLKSALANFDFVLIEPLVEAMIETRNTAGTILVAGNGGSASTAQHYAVDWGVGSGINNPPVRVLSLADNVPSITSTGNDLSFVEIFSRQLNNLAKSGDLLVVVSASGNSPDLTKVVASAKLLGVKTASVTGFDGGKLIGMTDVSIHMPTEDGDYGVAEDLHLMLGHAVKEALRAALLQS